MLSYELCRQLKKAGFPQDIPDAFGDEQSRWWGQYEQDDPKGYWCQSDGFNDDDTHGEGGELRILCKDVSLEDLLRELGEDFMDLEFTTPSQSEWSAKGVKTGIIYGTSPAEALASLYLAIHSKS